jgi:hypothetical protein
MTFELAQPTKRELSVQLADLFIQINTTFGHAKELILKAYNLAKHEGYSPVEAKHLIIDNITVFSKRTKYSYLPDECKDLTHDRRIKKKEKNTDFDTHNMDVIDAELQQIHTKGEQPELRRKENNEPVIPNNDALINTIDILKKNNAILIRKIKELEQKKQHPLNPNEIRGVHNIAPEHYELEHLHEYERNLLIDIIKYLHSELYTNKGNQQSQREQPELQPKDEWLLKK